MLNSETPSDQQTRQKVQEAKEAAKSEEEERQEESSGLQRKNEPHPSPLQKERFVQHWQRISQQMKLLEQELEIFVAQTNSIMEIGLTSYQQLDSCWDDWINTKVTAKTPNVFDTDSNFQTALTLEGDEAYGSTEDVDTTRFLRMKNP
jgi:uncharacterized membrane protein YdbT with pleckstrin-like domain